MIDAKLIRQVLDKFLKAEMVKHARMQVILEPPPLSFIARVAAEVIPLAATTMGEAVAKPSHSLV